MGLLHFSENMSLYYMVNRRGLRQACEKIPMQVRAAFRVWYLLLTGDRRLNLPCLYLKKLVAKKVFNPLLNRSGLYCRIIVGGIVASTTASTGAVRARSMSPFIWRTKLFARTPA